MSGGVLCSYCNKRGHIAPNCFLKARHRENQVGRKSYPSNQGYNDFDRNDDPRFSRNQNFHHSRLHQHYHPHAHSHPSTPERFPDSQPYQPLPIEQHHHFRNLSPSLLSRLSIPSSQSSSEASFPSPPVQNREDSPLSQQPPRSSTPSLQGDDSPPHVGPIRHFGSRAHKSGNQMRNVQSALAPAKAVFLKSISAAVNERGDDPSDASTAKSSPSFGEDFASPLPLPKSLSFYNLKEEDSDKKREKEEAGDRKLPQSQSESSIRSIDLPKDELFGKSKSLEWGLQVEEEVEEERKASSETGSEKGSGSKDGGSGGRGKGNRGRGRGRGKGGRGKGGRSNFNDGNKWINNNLAPIKIDSLEGENLLEVQLQNMLMQAAEEKAERQRLERQLKHREEQIAFLELQLRSSSIHDEHDEHDLHELDHHNHDQLHPHDHGHYDLEYNEGFNPHQHIYYENSDVAYPHNDSLPPVDGNESTSQKEAASQISESQTIETNVESVSLSSNSANDLSVH